MDYTPLLVARELRRIGVDEQRLSAIATTGLSTDAFLQWLRWLPTALGHDEFMRRFALGREEEGLRALLAGAVLAPADPQYVDRESEELFGLLEELRRVAPDLSGINFPRGRRRALDVLRGLPTGAGIEALWAALNGDPGPDV
jgi:hypothetical protein